MGLSTANPGYFSSPVQVGSDTTWSTDKEFGAGSTGLGLKTDGTMWAWGRNQRGELGLNSRAYQSSPIQIPGTTWIQSSSGAPYYHRVSAAIKRS